MNLTSLLSRFNSKPGVMKYLKNTSWLLIEKIIRLVIGLFVGIWVARYLGPEQFGLFSYVQSFVALFSTVATLGLNGILVRELVNHEKLRSKLIGTAFIMKLFGGLLVIFLLYLTTFSSLNNAEVNTFVFIVAFSTLFQSFNVIDFHFQSLVLSRYVVYSSLISVISSSVIKVIFILVNAPLIAFVYVVLFDSITLMLGYLYYYYRTNQSINLWRFNFKICKTLLKDSWPFIVSGVVVTIYMKIDQVMIKQMMDSNAVGQYAAAVRLSEAWYFIPMVICSSLFPAIVNAKKNSLDLYKSRCQSLYDFMTTISITVALFITFSANFIVDILYGIDYQEASSILIIHIWAGVFAFLGVANARWIINENLAVNGMIRTIIGAIANIILNIIFINNYGVEGAAMATLISYFIANYFSMVFFTKTRECFWQQTKSFNLFRISKKLWLLKS